MPRFLQSPKQGTPCPELNCFLGASPNDVFYAPLVIDVAEVSQCRVEEQAHTQWSRRSLFLALSVKYHRHKLRVCENICHPLHHAGSNVHWSTYALKYKKGSLKAYVIFEGDHIDGDIALHLAKSAGHYFEGSEHITWRSSRLGFQAFVPKEKTYVDVKGPPRTECRCRLVRLQLSTYTHSPGPRSR